jgi:hypothetical protein
MSCQSAQWIVGVLFLGSLLVIKSDGDATDEAKPTAQTTRSVTFQEGVDGYDGTADVELWGVAPTKPLGEQGTMTSDADNGGGESHILLKFDKIFEGDPGTKPGHAIPKRVRILRAKLVVIAFDPGNTVYLHPMLVPWDESATWNSMARGISADDMEASRRWDGFTFGQINMDKQSVEFDVTTTVQAWADGQANHGWVFLNSGGNGWDFYASEWQEAELRPALKVEWLPRVAAPEPAGAAGKAKSNKQTEPESAGSIKPKGVAR